MSESIEYLAVCWAGGTITPDQCNTLYAWVRERVTGYRDGARSTGWTTEPSDDNLAQWVGSDLGEPFESNSMLAGQLLDAAEVSR